MKNLYKKLYIKIFLIILFSNLLYSQDQCGTQEISYEQPQNSIGGLYKPHRTDLSNGIPSDEDAAFNMLYVFIQFQDESDNSDEWSIGQPPVYIDKILETEKISSGVYWDRYRDSSLSDYYQEISQGAFHVIGETRHFITDHDWSHYDNLTHGYDTLLTEIYNKLKADTTILWSKFDQWSKIDSNFVNEPDSYLDMMGLFFRRVIGDDFLVYGGVGGYVPLYGPDNFILFANSTDTVKIDNASGETGSGFVVKGNIGVLGYVRAFGTAIHEYGHYLLGAHLNAGIMTSRGGIGVNDLFMSGYERTKLGYNEIMTVNFNSQTSYSIKDVSGRVGSYQGPNLSSILNVPVNDTTEFFLIENRRKVSDWDVYMLGDTSQNRPFKNTGDYGKGVYIYHVKKNIYGSVQDDIECADGIWNWVYSGTERPDWSINDTVRVYIRSSIPNPLLNDPGFWGYLTNRDGVSCGLNFLGIFFSLGEKHSQINSLPGINRNFTNKNEYWTSRELWGDRNDAWNIGYNEIFSPYSNPNTKSFLNAQTGIFIYYKSLTNGIAGIEVYKAGEGGHTDSSILQITPPSKPMGLVVGYHPETENIMRPRLTWNHNKEPDMLNTSNNTKKYKIWRATSTDMSVVPTNYILHNIVEIDSGTAPSYIDTTIYAIGSGWPGMGNTIEYPVRYKIQAIDIYQDTSVRSDFAVGIGLIPDAGCAECAEEEGLDNINSDTELTKEFKLHGNYPNPFNPSTNIKFDLPKDVQVSIKIYDIAGREVKTLVNEFKTAGRYSVAFSGSDFASGVYYYKIKAGEFEQVRKMILLK